DRLIALIGALPQHERTATILHYLCGYSQADVATCLGLTESEVAKRLFSARRRLRSCAADNLGQSMRRQPPSRDEAFERRVQSRIRPFEDVDRSKLTALAHTHHAGDADERDLWLRSISSADAGDRVRRQYVVEHSGSREIVAFGAIQQSIYRPR